MLLKEENFFAMVRSRPKRPRHEKVPKTEAEPKIGADEGQGSGLDKVAMLGELPGSLKRVTKVSQHEVICITHLQRCFIDHKSSGRGKVCKKERGT